MKGILITSNGCTPCQNMEEHFSDLIAGGEVVVKSVDESPEEVMGLMEKYEVNIPSLLIVTDDGELLTVIQDEPEA